MIAVVIVACSSGLNTYASASDLPVADIYNAEVSDYVVDIQNKYLVRVKYPMRSDGYASIGVSSLETLEKSLEYVSADFIKDLSVYYKENYGDYLAFEFVYLNKDNLNLDSSTLGYFSSKTQTIYLFMPSSTVNSTVSGCSPLTITHEIGHAFRLYLTNKHGYDQLKNYWEQFNYGYDYSKTLDKNPDKNIFVSLYSTFSFDEDFAETFAYMFTSNRPGLGVSDRFYNDSKAITGLGRKVNYIETNIGGFLSDTSVIQNNLNIMRVTPGQMKYHGTVLSGNSLEYISFNAPYGVLENVLGNLKITPVRSEWLYEVGGWKIWDNRGGVYLVFPGARYVTLDIPNR